MGLVSRYIYGLMIISGIYIIMGVSLNLTAGFLGDLVMGHAGFMAVGAFASAICTIHMGLPVHIQLPISILAGGIVAAIFGFLICIPTMKVKGGYLAMITLGFCEIINSLLINMKITGGALGLTGIARFPSQLTAITYVFVLAAITIIAVVFLINSRFGRGICAIRDNEVAAESIGIPIKKTKLLAYTVSALFAGVGGALYAHYMGNIYANKFTINESFEMLVIVVLGGLGNIKGSVICAIALKVLPELLRGFNEYRTLIYGVILVAFMLLNETGYLPVIKQKLGNMQPKLKKEV